MGTFLISTLVLVGGWVRTGPRAGDPADVAELVAGAWERDGGSETLHFFGNRCVSAHGTQQTLFAVEYGKDRLARKPFRGGPVLREQVEVDGDQLTLRYHGGTEAHFVRLAEIPESARIEPLPLGEREVAPEERESIKKELRRRTILDQGIRERMGQVMEAAQRSGQAGQGLMNSPEMQTIGKEMGEIDTDNTRYLIDRIRAVGWIDAARWGDQANLDAFLIVQHSGNLRLMQAALPHLEQEAQQNAASRQSFALLFDRTQQELGKEQRYGSQLTQAPHGGS